MMNLKKIYSLQTKWKKVLIVKMKMCRNLKMKIIYFTSKMGNEVFDFFETKVHLKF